MKTNARIQLNQYLGGGIVAILGSLIAYQSLAYPLGSMRNLGAGAFPFVLGLIMVAFGVATMLLENFEENLPAPAWRPLFATLLSIFVFLTLIETAGLVPTIFATVFTVSHARPRPRFLMTAAIAAGLSIFATLIFVILLELNFKVVQWPI